jgi:PPOX class probable F420-dependent enzyme
MTIDEVRAFMRENHHAVLSTIRSDGGVQMTPVAVVVDDDGSLIISSRETAMKTRNIRRHPYAYVCAFPDRFYGGLAQAEGTTRVESLPDAMEGLVRYYRLVAGEHPDWDDYREAMARERRVLLRMQIERAGPSRQG